MALLEGHILITDSPFDGLLLEQAITDALAYRREHGKRDHPERLFVLQSECHMLAATEAETVARHAAQLVATPTPVRRGVSATMTVVEAQRILKKSAQMVRRDCESGVLDAVKVRDKWRISRASVEAAMARGDKSA